MTETEIVAELMKRYQQLTVKEIMAKFLHKDFESATQSLIEVNIRSACLKPRFDSPESPFRIRNMPGFRYQTSGAMTSTFPVSRQIFFG